MDEITTIFCDVGGVILTNGWDRDSRRKAAERFSLDWEDFRDRHELVAPAFDAGETNLEDYLERTIFYKPRAFSQEDFESFMFAQSKPYPEALANVSALTRTRKYFMAALNNEPLELNQYRIEHFRLRDLFSVFFSSCYLGVRKPDEAIYRIALQITQESPERCLFIDDRLLNVECAHRLGLRTIHYRNADQLREELRNNAVDVDQ